jgi:3-hydroxyacyl-CoA dehydrogenase
MADRIGLPQVLADIERLHAEHGVWWTPAPLLQRMVQQGLRFADWQPGMAKA